ncbi:ABC transporter ATP-binding protein [Streptomonospora nanhaiensis]|uniref:ABC-2 type transport system ATP-binding protein n=1 Tax=Streptomonospora nanhaiensis TaxID=1323731 RepID=A0A853BIE0_9ACTN|nr:ABC transporter ATP-binding protein [Streptomonospora nanhaiensis]MBV2363159.1 ABC transporter ATP-binding protein [Streptomonospora nanhaiensis]MBX9387434.1 ABC transporter ATP-binding protein [Streptomonospora nanhaiensis]NYI94347.1 ABC-2 type transport system ATP-binding protein [Streptomonospora nanhaiensis]
MAIIEVTELRKGYGGQAVLEGVSFSVEEGEVFGILGPNGAGKTTTVECVEGLRRPDSGRVRVLGADPVRQAARVRRHIGVQLQDTRLPDNIKVWEALDLYASFYAAPRDWRELLERWGLADKRDARFCRLSGGQRQRLFIALALVGDPKVAFLDELTTGLDPQARRATWELVKRVRAEGVTVVLVSHFMDEVEELCDRVAVLDRGRVVALDTPAGLIEGADTEYRMSFRLMAGESADPQRLLGGLEQVASVARSGDRVVVAGRGDFATAVTAALAREHVVVADLRIGRRTLDDAFVALTGRSLEA